MKCLNIKTPLKVTELFPTRKPTAVRPIENEAKGGFSSPFVAVDLLVVCAFDLDIVSNGNSIILNTLSKTYM
jgi:hypothetical protein